MAGLAPAIQSNIAALRFLPWMAAHVLGLDPGIKGGHDELRVMLPLDRHGRQRRPRDDDDVVPYSTRRVSPSDPLQAAASAKL